MKCNDAIGNPTEIIADYDGDIEGMYLTWEDGRKLVHVEGIALYHEGDYTLDFTYNVDGIRTSKTYLCEYNMEGYRIEYVVDGSRIISETKYTADSDFYFSETYTIVYIYDELGAPIGMMYRTPSYAQGVYDCFFFDKNLQGDIVGVYNASGTKVVSYIYDAWGNVTTTYHSGGASTGARYNPFRYRGYYYDTETKWYYLQTRYYNPAWGRFINADGYINANGDIIGFNMFAYCSNNPVMFIDLSGETSVSWTVAVPLVALTDPSAGRHIEENNRRIKYDVPLYEQKTLSICWAFCQLMMKDYKSGVWCSQAVAKKRAIALAQKVHGSTDKEKWNQGSWPNDKGVEVYGVNDIYDLFDALYNYGPLYAHYYGEGSHLVIVTGVDLNLGVVYTNNPWGVRGEQTFMEFQLGVARCWGMNDIDMQLVKLYATVYT